MSAARHTVGCSGIGRTGARRALVEVVWWVACSPSTASPTSRTRSSTRSAARSRSRAASPTPSTGTSSTSTSPTTDAQATGWVGGSDGQTYTTRVSLTPVRTPAAGRLDVTRWDSTCTLPGRRRLQARRGRRRDRPRAPARPRPRSPAAPRHRPAPRGSAPSAASSTTATLEPRAHAGRHPHRARGTRAGQDAPPPRAPAASSCASVRSCPGVRGAWIRTGVSWESFAGGYYGFGRVSFADEHRDALTAHRRRPPPIGARLRLRPHARRDPPRPPRPRLGRACCAPPTGPGCACSPTSTGEGEVAFAPDPAELVVEVVRTDDGAELHPRLDLPGGHGRRAPGSSASRPRGSGCATARPSCSAPWPSRSTAPASACSTSARSRCPRPTGPASPSPTCPGCGARLACAACPGTSTCRMPCRRGWRCASPSRRVTARTWSGGSATARSTAGVLVPLASEEPDPMRDRAAERALVDSLLAVDEVAGVRRAVAGRRPVAAARARDAAARVRDGGVRRAHAGARGAARPRADRRRRARVLQRGRRRTAHPGVDVGCR